MAVPWEVFAALLERIGVRISVALKPPKGQDGNNQPTNNYGSNYRPHAGNVGARSDE
jgi:hypothetical protein